MRESVDEDKEPWQQSQEEYLKSRPINSKDPASVRQIRNNYIGYHRTHVGNAIHRGEKVPQFNLDKYPDQVKKYAGC